MTTLTNTAAKVSALTSAMFNNGVTPQEAVVLATALITCQARMERGLSKWTKKMSKTIRGSVVLAGDKELACIDIPNFIEILTRGDMVVLDGDTVCAGTFLLKLDEPKVKHYPTPMAAEFVRAQNYGINHPSKLIKDAIHALERTMFRIDPYMAKVAEKVYQELSDDEAYVMDAVAHLLGQGNPDCIAEFKADDGGRIYQAACHGVNGQASDRSRAMMDLAGVHKEYDRDLAMEIINEEMDDMTSDVTTAKLAIHNKGVVKFIIDEINLGGASKVKKPWSFVKAYNILSKLEKGHTPYIGMAFGLDAKCSGPQYGALMVGDEGLAAATGFSLETVDDAYERACTLVRKAGFPMLTRNSIKTPFMATVYGQGYMALLSPDSYDMTNPEDVMFFNALYKDGDELAEENAKKVRSCIVKSLGKLGTMMNTVKAAHGYYDDNGQPVYYTDKATKFKMPDGQLIAPKYWVKVDINGDDVNQLVPCDVTITTNNEVFKMEKLSLNTKKVDLGKYQRTGLVRLIHSVDALVARLIVTHLDQDEGAQHIIAIHDCFRVNINDYIDGKLHRAIRSAYIDLFGSDTDSSQSGYMHKSVDMIKMYFEGVAKACPHAVKFRHSQFDVDGDRILDEVNGEELLELIDGVLDGETYYFSK